MRGRECEGRGVSVQETVGTTARVEEGVRAAAMRGGDVVGASALGAAQLVHATSTEPERGRPPRRSQRRDKTPLVQSSSHRVDTHPGGRAKGPVRNGCSVNSAASSSMRVEPAASARAPRAVPRDRNSSKRVRGGGPQSRLVVVEGNAVANGFHQKELVVGMGSTCDPIDEQHRVGEYFPLIQDELGLECLTRLPRHRIHKMAMVCKKWKEFLLSSELYKARRLLGVREDWVFLLGQNTDKNWRAFQPSVGNWVVLPTCPSDYTFDHSDKESMVAGLNLLVLGQALDGYIVWKFDTIKSKWSFTPRMHTGRCLFGSASFDKYAYFAGGTNRGTVLKSVERYNSETNSWELLAEMNHDRKACSGFVMDGKFHVIGGYDDRHILTSGEVYDPQTETWTVIEGMWPQDFVPGTNASPPLVAVLSNKLYGINIILNMLMYYNKERNEWQHLCKLPRRAENVTGWGLGFKAVGDELFVIGGPTGSGQFLPMIHAYRPREDGSREDGRSPWRFVTDLKISTNGFISNCAVMSG